MIATIRISALIRAAALLLILAPSALARAQSYDSCKDFDGNLHTDFDCIEALFSASPAHLTFSSMPPGNGFAIGGVLEQNNHYVSPFALPGAVRLSQPSSP